MKIIFSLIFFVCVGLVVGYVIFGRINDEYIPPEYFIKGEESIIDFGINKIYGIEEKREKILISGAIGGIVGLLLTAISSSKKNKNEKIDEEIKT